MAQAEQLADALCADLKQRRVAGALLSAKRTAAVLRAFIAEQQPTDGAELLLAVQALGTRMQTAKPQELAVGNAVRRVLHIIRSESEQEVEDEMEAAPASVQVTRRASSKLLKTSPVVGLLSKALRSPLGGRTVSLHNLLDQAPGLDLHLPARQHQQPAQPAGSGSALGAGPSPGESLHGQPIQESDSPTAAAATPNSSELAGPGQRPRLWRRKRVVLEQLRELEVELDGIAATIADQAGDYIHANEVILTFGMSETTLLFLKEAASKRDFQVIVAEGAPRYQGREHARQLAEAGIPTTAIADSAIFALMARVNKVLLGAHSLLANGGVMAAVGTHLVVQAARQHRVPVVVLAGLHKLSPLFPHDPSVTFNDFGEPADVLDLQLLLDSTDLPEDVDPEAVVQVVNPFWDYVPPELISLLLTEQGAFTPAYVYRLLSEFYSRQDYSLRKDR